MGASQRRKGHDFERKIARDLRELFPDAKRGFQTRGGTSEEADVEIPYYFIECKHHKKAPLRAALQQAADNCGDRVPVAICKDDRKDPIVLMNYEEFRKILSHLLKTGYITVPE
jgi:hypothetical protein